MECQSKQCEITAVIRGIRLKTFRGGWTALATLLLVMLVVTVPDAAGAIIYVTATADKISSSGGCSLKEAIYSANFDNNIAIDSLNSDGTDHFLTDSSGQLVHTECVAGSGDDRIVLPFDLEGSGAVLQMSKITDDAYNIAGPTATPLIFSNVTIEGFGAQLVWVNANKSARAFTIGRANLTLPDGTFLAGAGHLTIRNAYIKGFVAKGGDGGVGGGGGGMGAGGAIYADSHYLYGDVTLAIENSTFQGNGAIGGNGGSPTVGNLFYEPGGGGGGIGGNGGASNEVVGGSWSSGGGGGGARGNGADGGSKAHGGGGGGTVTDGDYFDPGLLCGGKGGTYGAGADGCAGGGGGGGGVTFLQNAEVGGRGGFGGGGGGGALESDNSTGNDGGDGGYGGGGGACAGHGEVTYNHGGNGGFGGGGGACVNGGDGGGSPGAFGGAGGAFTGGGGAALGGAIFNAGGVVTVDNSTFTGNFVDRGTAGGGGVDAHNGTDAGGAIFSLNGSTTVRNCTIAGNESTGSAGGIFLEAPSTFFLRNTSIANNGPKECALHASVITGDFEGNLIQNNDPDFPCDNPQASGIVSTDDPQLGPLQNNFGSTPTMAIPQTSPAWNTADPDTSLTKDQRGETRPQMGGFDIGAFELCLDNFGQPCVIFAGFLETRTLTVQASSRGGGTTIPAAGTYEAPLESVTVLKAIPNPNYCFANWTGDVTEPTSTSTTVVMDQARTVSANFVPVACPSSIRQSNDPNQCGAVVTYQAPTVDASCPFSCSQDSGTSFPVGTTTVTCTAGSCSCACTFTVTVEDTQKPTVTAPGSFVAGNDPGQCSATVNPGTAAAYDNCPPARVDGVRSDGQALKAPYPVGTTTITWTATDASGNTSAPPATQTVTVNDTEPPSLSNPTASPASLWPTNHKMKEETIPYTETDNCPGSACSLSVTSSEPVNGQGDGDTSPDWIVEDDHHEQLRAERSGLGDGRTYTTTVQCTDFSGNSTSKGVNVRVSHDMDAPAAGSLFPAGKPVAFSGHFLDVAGTTHTATWYFDNTRKAGTVVEPNGTTPGSVKGSYTFSSPGVYSVKMNVTDGSGQTGTATMVGALDAAVVIYPSSGGYVTGGGWIASPAGAYVADPTVTAKASFGFVSKSARTASSTSGETEFDLHLPGFKFNAVNFESQTVNGAKAQFRGTGTVNGSGSYKYLMTTIDGDTAGGIPDKFRIKIWDKSTGALVYDNEMGVPDSVDPVTSVGTGSSIVLHR